jgi:hypothetical protein
LDEALRWLIERNCIRLQPPSEKGEKNGRGRSKSKVYLVNPHLIGSQHCESQHHEQKPTLRVYNPVPTGNESEPVQAAEAEEVGDEEIPF